MSEPELPEENIAPEVDEFEREKQEALAVLLGIVHGLAEPDETNAALADADPALVYFLFKYIKKHYHRDHPDNEVVRGRLSAVTNQYRALTRRAKTGEEDPIVEWFEGSYRYDEMTADEFVDLVIEKLEG